MYGLNTSLSIAAQALDAQSGAIAVTNNNIANVDTVGYTRQVVNLSAEALSQAGGGSTDNGVSFGGYTSVRDQVLSISVNSKTSDQGSLNTQSTALATLQTSFSGTTSGLGAALSTFFSNISSLSNAPTDGSARQAVLTAAAQVASAFTQASRALTSTQSNANATVSSTVSQINDLAKQIAALNAQLSSSPVSSNNGALQDQRDQLTTQLSTLTGVAQTQTEGQPTLSTSGGSVLVVGSRSYPLQVATGSDGLQHIIDSSGKDVTSVLDGGTLGGALTVRDSTTPGMLTALNTLAGQFTTAVNNAQAAGYDQTGSSGQPLFTNTAINAAGTMAVALTSTTAIAASSDSTSSGSSGNVDNLLAVQTNALPSGQTPTDTYASLVTTIGTAASTAKSSLAATTLSLTQLTSQQSAESGVSVDEETTNLIRYQQAYTAAAHVVSTVNDLFNVVMNMTGGS